jgi:hypothetical protein
MDTFISFTRIIKIALDMTPNTPPPNSFEAVVVSLAELLIMVLVSVAVVVALPAFAFAKRYPLDARRHHVVAGTAGLAADENPHICLVTARSWWEKDYAHEFGQISGSIASRTPSW